MNQTHTASVAASAAASAAAPIPVLILDRFHQDAQAKLRSQKLFEVHHSLNTELPTNEICQSIRGLVVRSRTKVDVALLNQFPKLEILITGTSGFDHLDLDALKARGIVAMYSPQSHIHSVVELAWTLIFAGHRKIAEAKQQMTKGLWQRELLEGHEIAGSQVGIVGLGRIGSRMAQSAKAFGCEVQAFDPYQEDSRFEILQVPRVSYEELLKTSDIISFHVPKTKETTHMLNIKHLEVIQRGAFIVNTSRGCVIKELDLAEALGKGWVRGCGLDVFEKEPLDKTSHLLKMPQVVATPHIGAHTEAAFRKSGLDVASKLLHFFMSGTVSDTLPPEEAWYAAQGAFRKSLL